MMLLVGMLLRIYDGTANFIIYFDYYVIVTVIVTRPDVIKPILFICHNGS